MKPPRKLEPNKRVHVRPREVAIELPKREKTAPKAVYFRGARIK